MQLGDPVWVRDELYGWRAAEILSHLDSSFTVRCHDSQEEVSGVPSEDLLPRQEASPEYEDMVKMDELNEAVILHNLHARYNQHKIYTRIGQVLVSLNPFQPMGQMYGESINQEYLAHQEKGRGGREELAPHIYQTSLRAYHQMKRDRRSQAILISGESGAGKTEAAKCILQSLAWASSPHNPSSPSPSPSPSPSSSATPDTPCMAEHILQSNPVLEAFGNARTVCNNNSSRFGKFIQIRFSPRGAILGARIATYLLEKSRLVHQAPGERNFHVFYAFLCGASPAQRHACHLEEGAGPAAYHYLNQSQCERIPGVDDAREFQRLGEAMGQVGLGAGDQQEVWALVAAVLHLGNIRFVPRDSAAHLCQSVDGAVLAIDNLDALEAAADLLGIPAHLLEKNLLSRDFRGAGRGSVYSIPLELPQAQEARDALAKSVYARLFDYLVARINQHLGGEAGTGTSSDETSLRIGVLDIFGFESFEANGLEQLLINFANEKLQAQFNRSMFQLEQSEYEAEGLAWQSVSFQDNGACVELIEGKPYGLLPLLDEECQVPRGSEDKLWDKLRQRHATPPTDLFTPQRPGEFRLAHFAGPVTYAMSQWLEKNRDTLPEDLESLLQIAERPLVAQLFPAPVEEARGRSRAGSTRGGSARKVSVVRSFAQQLGDLVQCISDMDQHYIRCLKPNASSTPAQLHPAYTLRQLRCAGLLDTIRIRRAGFGYRRPFAEFLQRFRFLPLARGLLGGAEEKAQCEALLRAVQGAHGEFQAWAVGHSKVFLRGPEVTLLEACMSEALLGRVRTIERCVKSFFLRRRWHALVQQVLAQERQRQAEELRRRQEEEEKRRRQQEEEERRRRLEEEEALRRQQEEQEILRRQQQEEEEKERRRQQQQQEQEEAEARRRQEEEENKRRLLEEEEQKKRLQQQQQQEEEEEEQEREEEERNKRVVGAVGGPAQPPPPRPRASPHAPPPAQPPASEEKASPRESSPSTPGGSPVCRPAALVRPPARPRPPSLSYKPQENAPTTGSSPPSAGAPPVQAQTQPHSPARAPSPREDRPTPARPPPIPTSTPPRPTGGPPAPHQFPRPTSLIQKGQEAAPGPPPIASRAASTNHVLPSSDSTPGASPSPQGVQQLRQELGHRLVPPLRGAPSGRRGRGTRLPPAPPPRRNTNSQAPPADATGPSGSPGRGRGVMTRGPPPSPHSPRGRPMPPPRTGPASPHAPHTPTPSSPILPPLTPERAPRDPPDEEDEPHPHQEDEEAQTLLKSGEMIKQVQGGGEAQQEEAGSSPSSVATRSPRSGRTKSKGIYSTLRSSRTKSGGQKLKRTPSESAMSKGLLSPRGKTSSERLGSGQSALLSENKDLESIAPLTWPPVHFDEEAPDLHRQKVLYEFLVTERGYLDDLAVLANVFLYPSQLQNVLSAAESSTIFSNLESLITVNVQFFRSLFQYADTFVQSKDLPLGQLFVASVNFFMIYTEYCMNQPQSFAMLEEVQQRAPVKKFFDDCSKDERCRGLFINSFLIKPTQRICKYPLLLQDILKHTPAPHPDHSALSTALDKVKSILDTINERKRVSEASAKLIEISNQLEGCDVDLIAPTRRLMKEGLLEIALKAKGKPQEMNVFLFNDMIVFANKKKSHYEFRRRYDLSTCRLINVADMEVPTYSWQLNEIDTSDTITMFGSNEKEKKEWMVPLRRLINEFQRKKFTEMKK